MHLTAILCLSRPKALSSKRGPLHHCTAAARRTTSPVVPVSPQKASALGDADATLAVGLCYEAGRGTRVDRRTAVSCVRHRRQRRSPHSHAAARTARPFVHAVARGTHTRATIWPRCRLHAELSAADRSARRFADTCLCDSVIVTVRTATTHRNAVGAAEQDTLRLRCMCPPWMPTRVAAEAEQTGIARSSGEAHRRELQVHQGRGDRGCGGSAIPDGHVLPSR